jgi:hypothetical protein
VQDNSLDQIISLTNIIFFKFDTIENIDYEGHWTNPFQAKRPLCPDETGFGGRSGPSCPDSYRDCTSDPLFH